MTEKKRYEHDPKKENLFLSTIFAGTITKIGMMGVAHE